MGPQKTNAAVTTAAVTPAAIKIFSPSISLDIDASNQMPTPKCVQFHIFQIQTKWQNALDFILFPQKS